MSYEILYLDGTVKWKNENKDSIFVSRSCNYQEGDYIEINNDRTINYIDYDWNSFKDDNNIARKIDEINTRNNNNLASISQSQASGAIQMLNRAIDSDPRNKYTASMEVDPKTGNVFYHLSGERK